MLGSGQSCRSCFEEEKDAEMLWNHVSDPVGD